MTANMCMDCFALVFVDNTLPAHIKSAELGGVCRVCGTKGAWFYAREDEIAYSKHCLEDKEKLDDTDV